MLREHKFFFLPNLLSFTNGNTYLGSILGLRFRVKPTTVEAEDGTKRDILACIDWYGEYCLEESEVVNSAEFPMTEEGREMVIDWLEVEWQKMPKENGES